MTDIIHRAAAFAEVKHAGQARKDRDRSPYIGHPAEVAGLVAGFGGTPAAIAAAWLHDTVEDCPPTTLADIEATFGPQIAALVGELTDDKSLAKARRKRLQVEHAPFKSAEAALVKICDKISNVRSLGQTPPVGWSRARRLDYVAWAEEVVAKLPAVPDAARATFRVTAEGTRAGIASEG